MTGDGALGDKGLHHLFLHRRSIRLKGYDYAQEGAYFVTICTYDRKCLLGDVYEGEMRLNEYGIIARDEWLRTAQVRPAVETDALVIMPNHLHGIILITDRAPYAPDDADADHRRGVSPYGPDNAHADHRRGVSPYGPDNAHADHRRGVSLYAPTNGLRSPSQTIGAIVRGFKSASTKRINETRNTPGVPVWQRNYYEHVVRDEDDLDRIGITTNKPFDQWGQMFGGDDVIAAAILDRLLHHSHILVTRGPSYRMKDKHRHLQALSPIGQSSETS